MGHNHPTPSDDDFSECFWSRSCCAYILYEMQESLLLMCAYKHCFDELIIEIVVHIFSSSSDANVPFSIPLFRDNSCLLITIIELIVKPVVFHY